MANCIFAHPDYLLPGELYTPDFTGGSWSSDLPLTNLQDRRLSKVARSSSAAIKDTRFRADLKADRQVRVVAIPKHTLSSAGYARVLGVPSSLLFDYEAGFDISATGGTFARADASTCATYIDRNGVVRTVAAAVPRDGHFISSVRTLPLELSRTNLFTRSEQLDNAAWTKANCSISTDAAVAPDGTTSADKIVEAADVASIHNVTITTPSFTAGDTITESWFVAAAGRSKCRIYIRSDAEANGFSARFNLTGAGSLDISASHGTGAYVRSSITLIGSYYRISVTGTVGAAATSAFARLVLNDASGNDSYNGDGASGIYAWGAQFEIGAFPTTYIKTVAATVTRAVDVLSYPIPSGMTTPAASSFYVKFVERGTILSPTATRVLYVGESGGAGVSALIIDTSGTFYRARLFDSGAVTTSSSTMAVAPAYGDTVELLVTLSSTGSVQISQAINGAAFTSASAGAAGGLPTQWGTGTAKIFVNCDSSAGARAGALAWQSLRIASGVQTSSYMQSIVYDSGWQNQYPSGGTAETLDGMNVPWYVVVPSTQTAFRYTYLQIDDTANAAGYVDLGRLVVAAGWQPTVNFSTGAQFGLESGTVRDETDGFSSVFTERATRRTAQFTVQYLAESEGWGNAFQMQRIAGLSQQLFFVADADDSTSYRHHRSFLATIRRMTALQYPYSTYTAMPFELVEEL